MSFATFVDAPSPSRSSRLVLASMIACTTLALATSFALVLERMSILRMPGPKTSFELAAVVIAEPPRVFPLPKSGLVVDQEGGGPTDDDPDRRESILEDVEDLPGTDPVPASGGKQGIPGIPGTGIPCPGGVCGKGPIGIPGGGGGSCIGPLCKKTPAKAAPPKPLPLSSLSCVVCPDPSTDALRRTAAGLRKTSGTNVTRFCVDEKGHVEDGSVVTEDSHGDPAIDRLCRDAVKRWRFSPMKVAGEGRRACSEATFRIEFE